MTITIMRTIIEIPEQQLELMKPLLEQESISRAELIRRAIGEYLKRYESIGEKDSAFGLWSEQAEDGLSYQEALRSEWD